MPVDIKTEIVIDRPREDVSSFASDPDNAKAWYEHIQSVEWKTPRPLEVGSQIAFVANFLGRRMHYVYEVTAIEPGKRFAMRSSEGKFPMETTYTWEDVEGGRTRMSLRNHGEPHGFSLVAALLLKRAMRRANRKDLRRLKGVLEASS